MNKESAKEVVLTYGFLFVFVGFILGVLFTIFIAAHTTIIDVKHEAHPCVWVSIDEEPAQHICKVDVK
jgi:MFS superfamily sulfate permease-like transporter